MGVLPFKVAFLEENIPDELKRSSGWVVWKYETRNAKTTKPPYHPNGARAKVNDPTTWGTYEEARAALREKGSAWCGLGIMLTGSDNLVAWDLDHCLDPKTLTLEPWAKALVIALKSYTEITPSGTGLRILVRAHLPRAGAKRGNVECYQDKRYVTITGNLWLGSGHEIEDRDLENLSEWNRLFEDEKPADDEALIRRLRSNLEAAQLWAGDWKGRYASQSEADLALCRHLATLTQGDAVSVDRLFRLSALMRPKWDARHHADGTTYGAGTIARAIATYKSAFLLTDWGNAQRFGAMHEGAVRYCAGEGLWYLWNGRRWGEDRVNAVNDLALEVSNAILDEAKATADPDARKIIFKHGVALQSVARAKAMLYFAGALPTIRVKADEFDHQPELLNVANGTVNLKTGEFYEAKREDLLSKSSPVAFDPNAACDRWRAFVLDILANDVAMVAFIQRALGYTLTGYVSEQCLFFLYGSGANGKTTFVQRIQNILGEYAITATQELLCGGPNVHPTGVARLKGTRLAVASETSEGVKLNESQVKELTGGDRLAARRMREDFFEFDPTHKIWLHGNHKPVIRGTDDAIWRRIKLIPFTQRFPKNPSIPVALDAELPGILNWMIEGARLWFEDGLQDPAALTRAVNAYRSEQDVLSNFIEECLALGEEATVTHAVLFDRFQDWATANNEFIPSSRRLAERLRDRGFTDVKKIGNVMIWKGVRLA